MKQCICVNFLNTPPIDVKADAHVQVFSDVDPCDPSPLPKMLGDNAAIILMSSPERPWFEAARKLVPKAHLGLVTQQPMHEYHRVLNLEAATRCDHIFHNNTTLLPRMMRGLLQTLDKGFKTENYLVGKTQHTELLVKNTSDRHAANEKICNFAVTDGNASDHQGRNIRTIYEELLTNALYDAPVAGGLLTSEEFGKELKLDDRPVKLSFNCDSEYFLLSVRDPFGSFTKEKFAEYGHKIVKHHQKEDLLDYKLGGAGLGLLRILFYSHAMIVNVNPGKYSEVTVLLPRRNQAQSFVSQPRSFSYFISGT